MNIICSNTGNKFNTVTALGDSAVESDTSQTDIQSNTGTFVESINTAGSSNTIGAIDSAAIDSETEQSNTQTNDCGFATDCFNTGDNTNLETASVTLSYPQLMIKAMIKAIHARMDFATI